MRSQRKLVFSTGKPQHIYEKNRNGFVLFYRVIDYLFVITLFYIKCKKHKVRNESICIMPNHLHSLSYFESAESMSSFLWDFHRTFNKEYELSSGNDAINRFGSVPKKSRKTERSCDIYIDNNPVAGRLVKRAPEYRWNLMAYRDDPHPFSTKIVRSKASRTIRQALKHVDYLHSRDRWLGYQTLAGLFEGLEQTEKRQLEDYIIAKYNPVDYSLKDSLYSDRSNELVAKESTTGNEHDMPEDWEDHSVYRHLLTLYDSDDFHFEKKSREEILTLENRMLARFPDKKEQIHRFLHIMG